jgi:superfamily I DNA and/or RNA helicase
MKVLQQLLTAGELQPHMIGIVTPYAKQVHHLRRMIQQRGIPFGIDKVGRCRLTLSNPS